MSTESARGPHLVLRKRVSFWELGQPDESHMGYTTDVSATGCFLATNSLLPVGTEIGHDHDVLASPAGVADLPLRGAPLRVST